MPRNRATVPRQQSDENHGADEQIEQRGRHVAERQNLAREIDFRHELGVRDERVRRVGEAGRDEAPQQEPAEGEERVRHAVGLHACDAAEHQREDQHHRDRLEDGPPEAKHRLLVPNADAMDAQRSQEIGILRELSNVPRRPPGVATRPPNRDRASIRREVEWLRSHRSRALQGEYPGTAEVTAV